MKKDFWSKSRVAVLGGGSFGTVLAQTISNNCKELRLWVRSEENAREMNSTRMSPRYTEGLALRQNIRVYSDLSKVFEGGVQAVVWVLPSKVYRETARSLAQYFSGDEIILHATKGVEEHSLKRVSTILSEELPLRRIGVISGPNLATEIARGDPTATVVASTFEEVIQAGYDLLTTPRFRVYGQSDVVGVEWAGTLKNVLAIASGCLDGLKFGGNARAFLITRGLAEMIRFGLAMGGKLETFLGLAGMGDVLATCSSSLSRNYRVGYQLAQGKSLDEILVELGSVAEGVQTARAVWEFASKRHIAMPITESVYRLIHQDATVQDLLNDLMIRKVPESDLKGIY